MNPHYEIKRAYDETRRFLQPYLDESDFAMLTRQIDGPSVGHVPTNVLGFAEMPRTGHAQELRGIFLRRNDHFIQGRCSSDHVHHQRRHGKEKGQRKEPADHFLTRFQTQGMSDKKARDA